MELVIKNKRAWLYRIGILKRDLDKFQNKNAVQQLINDLESKYKYFRYQKMTTPLRVNLVTGECKFSNESIAKSEYRNILQK